MGTAVTPPDTIAAPARRMRVTPLWKRSRLPQPNQDTRRQR